MMADETTSMDQNEGSKILQDWLDLLRDVRRINLATFAAPECHQIFGLLSAFSHQLLLSGFTRESRVFEHVSEICSTSPSHGGLGLGEGSNHTAGVVQEVNLLLAAWLESLNSEDRSRVTVAKTQPTIPDGRPPMNTTEKIFAIHSRSTKGLARAGDTILVSIDWILASEASWSGMEKTYNDVGQPGIFRNDRFWLAGDHVVDPRVNHSPIVKRLIESSENARKVFKMTDYQGMNYTIMHTEFFRERAQPGMFIIGSDSHTCSSGANGCLSIGLGAADVTIGLITGEIWFKIPEVIKIKFIGCPARGVGGKDIILYVLQKLKRNTVAADRIVEYTGPGLAYLSPDARFAIANMTTEFGGVTGIFVPDHITKAFIDSRRLARNREASIYLRPDENATYAETFEIDLSMVSSFVAKYPNPDDVVTVTDMVDLPLDGCFIGACTTTEEDIILGALVLEQGLLSGMVPKNDGKTKKMVPGSRPILDNLEKSGLAAIYRAAGFEVGIPGCSYCVGMSADSAKPGEVWLSSQNRNFENRMGKGSIGHLASAATVAASSFNMKITDPQSLIDKIPSARWQALKSRGSIRKDCFNTSSQPVYVHPADHSQPEEGGSDLETKIERSLEAVAITSTTSTGDKMSSTADGSVVESAKRLVSGKIQRLGDFVDTDALAPAQFLVASRTNEALGSHCLEFTNPAFRQRVKDGYDVVVAGKAFGCGSSREQAVLALLGCGVKCVIAESFAFIYSRNQPSLGMIGITITDREFFEAAIDGESIQVDLAHNHVQVAGRNFDFSLSEIEKSLVDVGGVTPAFKKYGKEIFKSLCKNGVAGSKPPTKPLQESEDATLVW